MSSNFNQIYIREYREYHEYCEYIYECSDTNIHNIFKNNELYSPRFQ